MHKLMKCMVWLDIMLILVFSGILVADKEYLSNNIVRLHVVAASDSEKDQNMKLLVRDAVTQYLEEKLSGINSAQQAKEAMQSHLQAIEAAANTVLSENGSRDMAKVTLCKEQFPIRNYDTFSLPSGVYESLRVTIGQGEGKNWWCVVFPSLCIPAASNEVQTEAVSSGFSQNLANTITGKKEYKLSFFLLDCIGKLENIFYIG